MILEGFIYIKPAAWDAIVLGADKEIWHYAYRNAVSGYWLDLPGGFRPYNVIGNQGQLEALAAQFDPADIDGDGDAWEQGTGLDALDFWETNVARIQSVMKSPDEWGHSFSGQKPRRYASGFAAKAFSRGFR